MWIEIILIWKYSDKALLAESISVNYLSFLFTCLLFFSIHVDTLKSPKERKIYTCLTIVIHTFRSHSRYETPIKSPKGLGVSLDTGKLSLCITAFFDQVVAASDFSSAEMESAQKQYIKDSAGEC